MKKTISLLLVCVLLLGLSACGKAKPAAAEAPAPEAAAQQPAPAAPAVEGAPEAPAPAAAGPESSGQVQAAAPETAPETAPAPAFDPDFQFSATATDGSVYTEQVFAEHPLTIVCCWNAWMEDSVSGLASLEQLYQRYKDQGLMVLGVYTMNTSPEQLQAAVDQTGASFPQLNFDQGFIEYQSGTFPNTMLVDQAGHVTTHTPDSDLLSFLKQNADTAFANFLAPRIYTEALSFEDWDAIVSPYLG